MEMKRKSLAMSAVMVTAAAFSGRILGFVREAVIAAKFGATAQTDAYLVAFRIPNLVYNLLVYGALTAAFIPIFTGYLTRDKREEAWTLSSVVLNLMLLIVGGLTILLAVFAPWVVRFIASGFDRETADLASSLTRVMAPAMLFVCIAGLMTGILNSFQRFAAASLVSTVNNLIVVASAVLLANSLGIYGLAVGVLLGAGIQILIQAPSLYKERVKYEPAISFRHPGLVSMLAIFVPVLVALGVTQSSQLVDSRLASWLSPGSISWLHYAYRTATLPINTLVTGIIIVLFPTLSAQAARGELEALKETLSLGVRFIALTIVPAAVGLLVLSYPITKLLFQRGAFGSEATESTSQALAAYSVGLLGIGVNLLLLRAYYALKDAITPLKISFLFLGSLVAFDLVLVGYFGHIGLAVGYSSAITVSTVALFVLLRKRLGSLEGRKILTSLLKVATAALAMGIEISLLYGYLGGVIDQSSRVGQVEQVGVTILSGLVVYLALLALLRLEEIGLAWRMLRSKVLSYDAQA